MMSSYKASWCRYGYYISPTILLTTIEASKQPLAWVESIAAPLAGSLTLPKQPLLCFQSQVCWLLFAMWKFHGCRQRERLLCWMKLYPWLYLAIVPNIYLIIFGVNITLCHAQHSDIAIWLDAAFSNICMLPRRCVMNDVTTPDSLFWMIWRWLAASILPERLSATNRSFPWKLFLKACRKLFLTSAATSVAEGIIAAPPLGATWHFMND